MVEESETSIQFSQTEMANMSSASIVMSSVKTEYLIRLPTKGCQLISSTVGAACLFKKPYGPCYEIILILQAGN